MCWLVIMCALALIRTGTEGVVISVDKTPAVDSGDKISLWDECFSKCVSRCRQLGATRDFRCCNCTSLCENVCDTLFKTTLHHTAEETKTPSTPWSPCPEANCDISDPAWRRILFPRSTRKTQRRHSRSPMLREAAIIARSVGMDIGPLDIGSDQDETSGGSEVDESQVEPQLESLVRDEDAVTAQVSWGPLASPGLPPPATLWYLVAWEPEGGGVRGNLLTNSTSVSLTLWPDTVYHIQVSSPGARKESQCLEVDTHPPYLPRHVAHGITRELALSRAEELGGVAAAFLLFLVILLLSAKRWKNRYESSSKNTEHQQDCDHFKLFPPPVTLRHLAVESPTIQQLPV